MASPRPSFARFRATAANVDRSATGAGARAPRSRVQWDRGVRLLWAASPGVWAASARPYPKPRESRRWIRSSQHQDAASSAQGQRHPPYSALRGGQSLDLRFLGTGILGYFRRRVSHLGTL